MNNAPDTARAGEKKTRVNTAFAFICLFFGYALARCALFTDLGAGITVFVLLFVAGSAIFMRMHGAAPAPAGIVSPALMLLFSAAFIVSGDIRMRFLTLCFEELAAVYWYYSAFGCRAEGKIGDLLPFELLDALVAMPFSSFFAQPRFAVSALKSTKAGRNALYIVIGVACSVIPGMVIVSLLVSADEAFANLMDLIYKSFLWSVGANLLYIAIGLPVAMYIFGLMVSTSTRKNKSAAASGGSFRRAIGFVPPAVVYSSLAVILAIYALFFAAQSSYFLSAFASLKPAEYSYADYARRGFFELCRVAAINGLLVMLAELFIRRAHKNKKSSAPTEDGGHAPDAPADSAESPERDFAAPRSGSEPLVSKQSAGLRVCNVLMGISTLFLIAAAAAKLYMYIDCYGLTPARVEAAWFTLLLGVAFIFLIIRQAAPRFNFWRAAATAFILLFAALIFSNSDALIARYNIGRFYDGSLPSVDVELFYSLSDSALPELAGLLERDKAPSGASLDAETRLQAEKCLEYRLGLERTKQNNASTLTERINYALGYNLPRGEIERLLDESGK